MISATKTWRCIGWNGISLNCPRNWEIFVCGDKHLTCEQDFQPVFELRWQTNRKKDKNNILRSLLQESGMEEQKSIPPSWQSLTQVYTINLLKSKESNRQQTALLTCRQCGTTLLFFFFRNTKNPPQDFTPLIASIRCHNEEKEEILWAIQDFRLFLPQRFQLSSHSFAAGLSRLSFIDSGLSMHICRLSRATERLQSATLTDLLHQLGGISAPEKDIIYQDLSVLYYNHPSIFQQVLVRLKRKHPFHWMTLRHHPSEDRLTGLFFEDKKPLPEKEMSAILNSYEIIPL